jgi:hypothetical protein
LRNCDVTGVTGLVGDDGREASASRGLDEDFLDAGARSPGFTRSESPGSSAFKLTARLSEEEPIDVLSKGGKLLELRRGSNEGIEISDGEIEPGVLGEAGEDREGESRASKYGEDDDEEENNLEDLSEDTDFFENKAVRDGRFTLVGFRLCELGSDGKSGGGRMMEEHCREGVPGAVSLLGNVTGTWSVGWGDVRTKSGIVPETRFSLA